MGKNFVAIGVNSIDESLDFYCDFLEFKLSKRLSPAKDVEIAWIFNEYNFIIELVERKDKPRLNDTDSPVTLTFRMDCFSAKEEWLKKRDYKYELLSLPGNMAAIRLKDPNGVAVSLVK